MTVQNSINNPLRKVGFSYGYTGTDGSNVGFFDDFDGKWVYLTLDGFRTIGNASSGASIAASWTQILFEHFWNQYDNTRCPVLNSSGGTVTRGASATADYTANRRISFPDMRGRVLGGAGTGSSLSARTKGATTGAETHVLTTTEIPAHSHGLSTGIRSPLVGATAATGSGTDTQTGSTGGGTAHNNMQPTAFEHLLISAGAR